MWEVRREASVIADSSAVNVGYDVRKPARSNEFNQEVSPPGTFSSFLLWCVGNEEPRALGAAHLMAP